MADSPATPEQPPGQPEWRSERLGYDDIEGVLAVLLDGVIGIGDRIACVQSQFFDARAVTSDSVLDYVERNQTSKSNLYRLHKTARPRWRDARRCDRAAHSEPWQQVRNLIEHSGAAGISLRELMAASPLAPSHTRQLVRQLQSAHAVQELEGRLHTARSLQVATHRGARRNLGLYLLASMSRIVRKRLAAPDASAPYTDGSAMGQGQRRIARKDVAEMQRRIHEAVRAIANEFEEAGRDVDDTVDFQFVVGTHTLDESV